MLKDTVVTWDDFYQTPLWRKWQDKQNGNSDEYQPMHDMENFESPEFLMLVKKMGSDDPRSHARHTPDLDDVIEKVNKPYSLFCDIYVKLIMRLQDYNYSGTLNTARNLNAAGIDAPCHVCNDFEGCTYRAF